MSALTIGLAAAGTIIGVGLVYYGLKGSGAGAGAGAGAAPYVPTTYDNLEGPRQQVYGGRGSGRKSKRTGRSKRTDASRRRRRTRR